MTRALAISLVVALAACSSLLGIEALPQETGDAPLADTLAGDTTNDSALTGVSCADLHAKSPDAGDGVYEIELGGTPRQVYCDMTIAGGGWTLILAYTHAAGDLAPLVAGTIPLSPDAGYSHMSAAQLTDLSFADLRFFCSTDQTPRVMHFVITVPEIVTYFRGQGPNSTALWLGNTTLLGDHTALLPGVTDSFRTGPTADENMTFFPFLQDGADPHLWALRAFPDRWECDDRRTGAEAETLHQIWAR